MADAHKAAKPSAHSGGGGGNAGLWIFIAIILVLVYLFGMPMLFNAPNINIEYYFNNISNGIVFLINPNFWYSIGILSALISVFFIGIIIYSLTRIFEIQEHEEKFIDHEIRLALARDAELEEKINPKWRYILGLMDSSSESDWRVAIIEADNILDALLQDKGYSGNSIGERLISARDDGVSNIENGWQAHIVRNNIAHQGSDFSLTQLETRRTIRLYETVFSEFNYI